MCVSVLRRLVAGGVLFATVAAGEAAAAAPADGAALFKQMCSACHQPAGQGIPGAFPRLAGDAFVAGDPKTVATLLLTGRRAMPNFSATLSNEQIAAVLTYVRTSWGNHAPPVTVADVAKARAGASGSPRPRP